jgi:hypothetical protein
VNEFVRAITMMSNTPSSNVPVLDSPLTPLSTFRPIAFANSDDDDSVTPSQSSRMREYDLHDPNSMRQSSLHPLTPHVPPIHISMTITPPQPAPPHPHNIHATDAIDSPAYSPRSQSQPTFSFGRAPGKQYKLPPLPIFDIQSSAFVRELKSCLETGVPLQVCDGLHGRIISINSQQHSLDDATDWLSDGGKSEPYSVRAVLECVRAFKMSYIDYLAHARYNDIPRILLVDRQMLLDFVGSSHLQANADSCFRYF